MTKLIFPLFPALVFFTTSAIAADTGYIQVKAPSGITIFLDGNFKGKTTAGLGGIILEDVPAGKHVIKAVKSGFNPKVSDISVKADSVAVWEAGTFAPMIRVRETGEVKKDGYQPVGSLVIQSVPIQMGISVPDLGFTYNKQKNRVEFSEVPAGKYAVAFSGFGRKVESQLTIYDKRTTELFVNLLKGEVRNKTEEKMAAELAAKKAEEDWRVANLAAIKKEYGKIIAEAIDEDKLQVRGTTAFSVRLRYAPNQQTPYSGWSKWMYDNGQIRELIQYKNGERDGLEIYWHKDGWKVGEKQYKDGTEDGLETSWYSNGQKKWEITYKDGKLTTVDGWKPNGEKCPHTKVVNGNGVLVYYLNPDGTESGRKTFKDGHPVRD